MQSVYAILTSKSDNLTKEEKFLKSSIDKINVNSVVKKVKIQLIKALDISTTNSDIIKGQRTTKIGRFLIKISVILQISILIFYLFLFHHDNQLNLAQICHLPQYFHILNLFLRLKINQEQLWLLQPQWL